MDWVVLQSIDTAMENFFWTERKVSSAPRANARIS